MLNKICLFALALICTACGTAQFSSSNSPKAPVPISSNDAAAATPVSDSTLNQAQNSAPNNTPVANTPTLPSTPTVPSTPTPPVTTPNPPVCPPHNANILILDFKSGWWSGDGGDFVNRVLSGFALSCSTVKLEYHHIIKAGYANGHHSGSTGGVENLQLFSPGTGSLKTGSPVFASAFADATWASYTQIWVLSGSSADPEDLQPNDPFFVQVVQHIQSSKANVFIGVGYGSISHGNTLAAALSVGASFTTEQAEGSILDPMGGVQLKNTISGAQLVAGSPLFDNGIIALADEVVVAGVSAHGDAINNAGGVNVVATDNLQQATLAVGTAGTRRIVLDAGMPRYYAAWSNESTDTIQLQQNIVVYLANQ